MIESIVPPIFLSLIKKVLSNSSLPGRYWLAQIFTRYFFPKNLIVDGQLGAFRVSLNLSDTIQNQIYFEIYDPYETQLLQYCLIEGSNFLDIGANIGYYSLIASQIVGPSGKVHAFEPISANIAAFQQTIDRNQINNIVLNQVAVGSANGELILFTSENQPGSSGWASKVPSERRQKECRVPMTSLDKYLGEGNFGPIRLVKMDIEGAELDALAGGQRVFSGPAAPDLIIEINPFLLQRQSLNPQSLIHALERCDYQLFLIGELPLKKFKAHGRTDKPINLFCTKSSTGKPYLT